ncbi:MAG: polysaccharide pyruvyl transferase family protein [Clostridiales bacterium]|jgi:GT2 family glycosyltransferase|nr:polysaccharide pyruvyl transferase family protein [Clostridiales bacterium]
MKTAIASLWFDSDYGDIIGAWALFKYMEERGYEPVLLNKPPDLQNGGNESVIARKFFNKRCDVLPVSRDQYDYDKSVSKYDVFLSFGGRVWDYASMAACGHHFYFDFVSDAKKKIAYGAGFAGKYAAPGDYSDLAKYYLSAFAGISAAGPADAGILKEKFGIKADIVCRPEFLLKAEDYLSLADESAVVSDGDIFGVDSSGTYIQREFIAAVIRESDPVKTQALKETAAYASIVVKEIGNVPIEDYIWYIANCESVITDSYAAAVLALILNKPIAALTSCLDSDSKRISELLGSFGLSSSLVDKDNRYEGYEKTLIKSSVPYKRINNYIKHISAKSAAWLQEIIENAPAREKIVPYDGFVTPDTPPINKPLNAKIVDYKIQNLLFPDCAWKDLHWWMMHRGGKLIHNDVESSWTLKNSFMDCFTYFNSLSVRKWDRYTEALGYKLHLKIKGKFWLQFFGHWLESKEADKNKSTLGERLNEIRSLKIGDIQKRDLIHKVIRESTIKKEEFRVRYFDSSVYAENADEAYEFVFPVEYDKSSIVGFVLTADTECVIYGGHWSAECLESRLKPVDISLCITTFERERYITENIKLLREEILFSFEDAGMDELTNHLFINVVDNGRTLKPDDYDLYQLKVYPNPNTGGAGGFTRGMIETLGLKERGEFDATHILFMDDDVTILPESIKRTYALLRLMKYECKERFISGAMLDMNQMNILYEDVGFIDRETCDYHPIKQPLHLHLYDNVLWNEENYEFGSHYAAWWYCCAPISFISKERLSLPLFIRGDDVEFSLRNNAEFITLNGICLWHMAFTNKISFVMEHYLTNRNKLFIQAVGNVLKDYPAVKRIDRRFFVELRCFNYSGAEMLMDAFEDFLKGPEFFLESDAEAVFKERSKKEEKLLPLKDMKINVDFSDIYTIVNLNQADAILYKDTDNGHTLPDYLLKEDDNIPVVAYDLYFESPGKQWLRKKLIAVNAHNETAVVRVMDKQKYDMLIERHNELTRRYETIKDDLYAQYDAMSEKFHSFMFWKNHLNL